MGASERQIGEYATIIVYFRRVVMGANVKDGMALAIPSFYCAN